MISLGHGHGGLIATEFVYEFEKWSAKQEYFIRKENGVRKSDE